MRFAHSSLVAAIAVLAFSPAVAQKKANRPARDHGKQAIEVALKKLVATEKMLEKLKPKQKVHDRGKGSIENGLKAALSNARRDALKKLLKQNNAAKSNSFKNPKVRPGKVVWHNGFKRATSKADASGKPVLLFQMIGRLDERFS